MKPIRKVGGREATFGPSDEEKMGCTVTRRKRSAENSFKESEGYLEESGTEGRSIRRTIDEQEERRQGLNNARQKPADPANDKFAWLISNSPR